MQQLRGWSPLETGLAIFPGGLLVALALAADRAARRCASAIRPADHRRARLDRGRIRALPAHRARLGLRDGDASDDVFAGLGFALAYGPLNIAATNGVAPEEQGLAGGLVNTSFQFGGALVLAVATAVDNANTGADGSPQALLDGFQAAVVVSVIAATLGVVVTAVRLRSRVPAHAAELPPAVEPEVEAEAA